MPTDTTYHRFKKALGGDLTNVYLKTYLAGSLDDVDAALGPVYSVREDGAVGDGTTDDGPAIRAAMTKAAATGGVVEFPGGPGAVYALGASGATYSLTLASNVALRGDGATIKRRSGNTEQLIGAASAVSDVLIQGLTVDNQDAVVFDGGLVHVPNGSSRVTLSRCRFVGLAYAIAVQVTTGTGQSSQIRILDCAFERTLAASSSGSPASNVENVATVGVYDASDVWVERCRFDNVNALHLEALNATACPTSAPMSRVHLLDCTFTRIKTTCVFATPAASCAMAQVVIEGNAFHNVGKELEKGALALAVAGTTDGVVVRGNVVRDWGYTGSSSLGVTPNAAQAISVGAPSALIRGLVIQGNAFDASTLAGVDPPTGNYGISVGQSALDVVIVGNRIARTGYAGIRVQGGSGALIDRWVIANNTIVGCALHNDASLKEGGIVVTDYATNGTIAGNLCVDNGSGGGATGQDAGIALRTGTSATTIADVKIHGNHCLDTRAGGSKKQLYGVRVGDTGSADATQPTRITVQDNDVTGNATAGLFYQATVDLGYVVAGNMGHGASGVYVVGGEWSQVSGLGARIGNPFANYQGMALGRSAAIDNTTYNLAANTAGNLLLNALTGQTLNLRVANADVLTIAAAVITAAQLLTTLASGTGGAGFRLPHGATPTSPVNGDMWTTTAGLFVRINGATVGPLS